MKKSLLFILISTAINQAYAETSKIENRKIKSSDQLNNICQLDSGEECLTQQNTPHKVDGLMIVRAPIPVPVNGNTYYDSTNVNRLPTKNGNITDLLKTNPAVRFNGAENTSMNQGSIDPQLISFHGASPYQNLFLIDGISSTNIVSPSESNMNDNGNNIIGNTQGYFLDVSLLDSIRVYDSNVPVEYGDFNGGVIDARLGRFSGDDKFKISYRTTRNTWNKEYIKDAEAQDYSAGGNGTTKIYSPNYRKHFYSISFDKQLTETLGFIGGISHRESNVNRTSKVGDYYAKNRNKDNINTFLGKISWLATEHSVHDFSLKYNKANHEIQNPTYINSGRDMGSEAYGLAWQYERYFTQGKLTLNAGWDHMGNYTKPDANTFYTELPCTSISGVTGVCNFGGQGHISEGMDSFTGKTRWDFNQFNWGNTSHNVYMGFDYKHIDGEAQRHTEGESYRINPNTGVITNHLKYRTGKGSLAVNHYALYLSDTIKYGRFSITPGLRYDYDSFLSNHNLAPRVHSEIDLFNNSQTILTSGFNRYYGTSFIGMGLRDIRSSWKYNVSTGLPASVTVTNYDDLKTPYSDEWTIGARQLIDNYVIGINYVHRFNRDQFNSKTTGVNKTYSNDGYTKNDSYNINIGLLEAWRIKQVEINPQLVMSYVDKKGNISFLREYSDDGEVVYNGKVMDMGDVPSRDFNTPWVVALNLDFSLPDYNVIWGNTFTYQSGQEARIKLLNRDDDYDMNHADKDQFKDVTLGSSVNWDMHISWQPRFIQKQPLTLTVDILNVLNRRYAVPYDGKALNFTTSSANLSNYGPGRQIWLQIDYTF